MSEMSSEGLFSIRFRLKGEGAAYFKRDVLNKYKNDSNRYKVNERYKGRGGEVIGTDKSPGFSLVRFGEVVKGQYDGTISVQLAHVADLPIEEQSHWAKFEIINQNN